MNNVIPCLTPDRLVLLQDNTWKKASDIAEEDKMMVIVTPSLTQDHLVLVNGVWKKACDVVKGDNIVGIDGKSYPIFNIIGFKPKENRDL